MKYLIHLIRDCSKHAEHSEALEEAFGKLRQRIHQAEFYDFLSGNLIKKSKLLESEGLPMIFESEGNPDYPWDIRADSLDLYRRWIVGRIDPHLLVGIETKQKSSGGGKSFKSRNLQQGWPFRVSCNYVGEGDLCNGRWWPLQICALRDGAHGEIEAGIHGQTGKGAFSVVLSSGGYADVDDGETVKYCGTVGSLGQMSEGTKHMVKGYELGNPVRVLRSSSLHASNQYRPEKGLRYDGLYEITNFEVLDVEKAIHRFWLIRKAGQDPIRYGGVEKRPTSQELAEYAKIRSLASSS